MPKRTLSQVTRKVLPIDWLLVVFGVLWLLLLWSYSATSWQIVILGFGTAGWWFLGKHWSEAREKITGKAIFSLSYIPISWGWWWLIWLVVVCTNLLTSQIPLQSGVVVFWWLMSGLWFWWWSSLTDGKLRNWLVTHIGGGGLLLFALFSWWVAWLQPRFVTISSLSLSPNFLLPFFGHHHIAALIVLIWPLLWWLRQWWSLPEKTWRLVMAIWLTVLGGTIWFAFSRSAWLALLLQAGIFSWLHRTTVKKNLKIWILAAGIFISLLMAGFLLKNLLQSQPFVALPKSLRVFCYQWWSPSTLCSVSPEPRPEYWKQAFGVWQQFPWFGSGLDTFGQVAKRWQDTTLFQTQYTHQIFLQVLTEQGLVGLLVWLGFLGLLVRDFLLHSKQKTALENWPFFLALFGALVIGNFDFDWQLAGFWWPLLMVLSCVIFTARQFQKKSPKVLMWLLWCGLLLAVAGATLSAVSYLYITSQRVDSWVKKWPYSVEWQSQMSQRIKDKKLWQVIVQRYYRQSPEVWFGAMTGVADSAERWLWLEQLWLIDPWRYWETNPLATARKNQNLVQINLVLDRFQQWLADDPESKIQKYNPVFAAELLELADQSLQQEDWEVAAKALQLAQVFDPWVLHNRLPSIVDSQVSNENIPKVLRVFTRLNQDAYGDYLSVYRAWYQSLILRQAEGLLQRRVQLVGQEPFSTRWLPTTTTDVSDWTEQVKELGMQSQVLLPDPQSRGFALSKKIAELLLEAGDATVATNTYQVSDFYQLAQQIEPWVLNGKLWWFERMQFVKPNTQEFLSFAADWLQQPASVTGYKPQAWILFYNRVLLLSLRSGNIAAAFESLQGVTYYWQQTDQRTQ